MLQGKKHKYRCLTALKVMRYTVSETDLKCTKARTIANRGKGLFLNTLPSRNGIIEDGMDYRHRRKGYFACKGKLRKYIIEQKC